MKMKHQRIKALVVAAVAVLLTLGGATAAFASTCTDQKPVTPHESGKPHDDSLSPLPCSMTKGNKPCVDDKNHGKKDECGKHKVCGEAKPSKCGENKPSCGDKPTTTAVTKPSCEPHKQCGDKPTCEKKCETTSTTSTMAAPTTTTTVQKPTTTTTKPAVAPVVTTVKPTTTTAPAPKLVTKVVQTVTTTKAVATVTPQQPVKLANTGVNAVTMAFIALLLLMTGGALFAISRAVRGRRMLEDMNSQES